MPSNRRRGRAGMVLRVAMKAFFGYDLWSELCPLVVVDGVPRRCRSWRVSEVKISDLSFSSICPPGVCSLATIVPS